MKLFSLNGSTDVSPDDLAAQLTLIDLPIFKSIKIDELTTHGGGAGRSLEHKTTPGDLNGGSCCSCSAIKKLELSPGVVAMNRQFNQVTFWVVGQILSYESAHLRAELISYFIRMARRLYSLNNLHSSFAVISALLISPIYRLERTWHILRKKYPKEKMQFDHLRDLYSDNNNYEQLRYHLNNCDIPCIPYLGMYSRDIIYLNEVYPEGTIQRTKATSKILRSIERFQSSNYENLVLLPDIYNYLLSSRYIDELQKFVEDENYRRSLELEPPDNLVGHSNQISNGFLKNFKQIWRRTPP